MLKAIRIKDSLLAVDLTGPVSIPSTDVAPDTIDWRQWRQWNFLRNFEEIQLEEGIQLLTLHTLESGEMNCDFLSKDPIN